ncbi:MAG: histidine phosphatase family protein [Parasporobacterium sp.]|nr:histidine phosphatase family protein [Parasporobacterium sp.]
MKKIKKLLCLMLVLALACTFFVACDSKGNASGGSDTQAASSDEKGDGTITFYIIRHGEQLFNATNQIAGWVDSPLTEKGIAQAQNLGKGLKAEGITFDAAYCSTSERSVDTTDLVLEAAGQSDLNVEHCKGLKELYYGDIEGKYIDTLSEIMDSDPYETDDPDGWKAYGGETWAETGERAKAVLEQAIKDNDGKGGNILISTHGMTIVALCKALTPDSDLYKDFRAAGGHGLSNCSVTIIEYKDGQYTLKDINDKSFRDAGENL